MNTSWRMTAWAVAMALVLAGCGEEDALRQQVQDLEAQRAELVTMNEKLRMENDDLQVKLIELQTEVESLRAVVVPVDTAAGSLGSRADTAARPGTVPTR